jgi:hypothetical protein
VSGTRCGYAYAVAVPVSGSTNSTPSDQTYFEYEIPTATFASSYQIFSGLDPNNQPVPNASIRISDYSASYTMTVSGLQNKLVYEVYVTFENDWPKYQSLTANSEVARIEMKTLKKRSKDLRTI